MPPPSTKAAASYKKKDGQLAFDGAKSLSWTPAAPPGSKSTLTIPIADITNLQQTPASSAKVALKILVKEETYVFNFTSKDNARKEQEAMTAALSDAIAASKADAATQLVPSASKPGKDDGRNGAAGGSGGQDGQPAAMAIAKAVSSKAAEEAWYDDKKLKSDFQLQRSLLEANATLKERFNQALRDRPESVSVSQFTAQFWSARLHLLRAHAIEKAQKQGEYNVLPEIKFVHKQGEKEGDPGIRQLNITKEQIKLIFKQYPVVSEAYNDNVPPMDAGQFWQRFFGSRLLKKLKGEKIVQSDPTDQVLDRYLDRREAGPASIGHIPHFMDLEGNEQNHSQRKGNRPDEDMRPGSNEKVPVLRVLNNLSEKMLSHVAPSDGQAHAPVGMDENTYEQLQLRDLAMEDVDNRVVLNVRQQQGYLGGGDAREDLSADAKRYAKQDPTKVLALLNADLQPSHFGSDADGTLRLDAALGYHSDPESDDDDPSTTATQTNGAPVKPINSHAALRTATTSILRTIASRRTATATDPTALHGLPPSTFDQLTITHNTTTEFLHYFWTVFLSGDSSRAAELPSLLATLDRSLDRIGAVADAAEREREGRVEVLRRQKAEWEKRTGKRRKLDLGGVEGGRAVVEGMVAPTVDALKCAGEAYRRALGEQEAGI